MIFVLNWNFLRRQKCSTWMLSAEPATNISCVCFWFSLFSGTQCRYRWQCTQCTQYTQCGYRWQRSLKCCPLKVAVSSQQGLISVCTHNKHTQTAFYGPRWRMLQCGHDLTESGLGLQKFILAKIFPMFWNGQRVPILRISQSWLKVSPSGQCVLGIYLTAVVADKFEKGGDCTFQKGPGLLDTLERVNISALAVVTL